MKRLLPALAAMLMLSGCVSPERKVDRPWQLEPRSSDEVAEAEATGPRRGSGGGLERGDPDYQRPPSLAEQNGWDPRFAKGCEMSIASVWTETDKGRYIIEAESKTESCQDVELSLKIRAPNKRVIYRIDLKAAEVHGFQSVTRPTQMRGALIDWATNYGSLTKRSGRLPYWAAGALKPNSGSAYPFVIAERWERSDYLEVRARDLPVYCHVISFESMNCLLLRDANQDVILLGIQMFPPRQTTAEASQ